MSNFAAKKPPIVIKTLRNVYIDSFSILTLTSTSGLTWRESVTVTYKYLQFDFTVDVIQSVLHEMQINHMKIEQSYVYRFRQAHLQFAQTRSMPSYVP